MIYAGTDSVCEATDEIKDGSERDLCGHRQSRKRPPESTRSEYESADGGQRKTGMHREPRGAGKTAMLYVAVRHSQVPVEKHLQGVCGKEYYPGGDCDPNAVKLAGHVLESIRTPTRAHHSFA